MLTLTSYSTTNALVVNLIDAKTRKPAWVALAKDTLNNKKPEPEKLDKAAAKMFTECPPKKP